MSRNVIAGNHYYLEIRRHEGVVNNHYNVFAVLVHQVRAGLDVHHLHQGVGWRLEPHQLHQQRQEQVLVKHIVR